MEINYKYLEDYVMSVKSIYRIHDLKKTLEELYYYIDYYPKEEIPEYYRKFNITVKECNKLMSLCNRRIKDE